MDGRIGFHGSLADLKRQTGQTELEGAVACLIETGTGQ
jgi:hypothetical protein